MPCPVDIAYNGEPVGDTFNAEKATKPLTRADYKFAGRAGDTVSVLAYAFRSADRSGFTGEAGRAGRSRDRREQRRHRRTGGELCPDLKSTKDAVIQNITLPADGIYTIHVQPEPFSTSTKIKETFSATNKAYDAFLLGPLSRLNRWVIWIRDALTLIMLGLAIAIVFRAEQFSLGAEGQLVFWRARVRRDRAVF